MRKIYIWIGNECEIEPMLLFSDVKLRTNSHINDLSWNSDQWFVNYVTFFLHILDLKWSDTKVKN
jgi:hypothetical protein